MTLPIYRVLLIIVLTLTIYGVPTIAQDSHPLLEMLSLIPDTEIIRNGYNTDAGWYPFVTYVDYEAQQVYAPTDIVIETADDFFSLSEDEQANWLNAYNLRQSGTPRLPFPNESTGTERDPVTFQMVGGPPVGEAIEIAFGFDYFAINQGMTFGLAPAQGTIFGVEYDTESVNAALQERGYADSSQSGVMIWCQVETGCDGTQTDRTIEPQNIFDNRLGRNPPIIAVPNYLYSVFDEDLLATMVQTQVGEISSLADADDYRVIAESIIDPTHYDGDLVSAYIFAGASLYESLDLSEALEFYQLSEDEWFSIWGGDESIAEPLLLAIADRQSETTQTTVMAILFNNTQQAEEALPELMQRVNQFPADITSESEPLLRLISAEMIAIESYIYTDEESEMAVVIIGYSSELSTDNDQDYFIDQLMIYWLEAALSDAFYPLWNIN